MQNQRLTEWKVPTNIQPLIEPPIMKLEIDSAIMSLVWTVLMISFAFMLLGKFK